MIYNDQHFGRMEITDSSGIKQWINILLKDTNQALESCEFKNDLKKLKTTRLCRWKNNEKIPKVFKNKTSISMIESIRPLSIKADTAIDKKIALWNESNNQVTNNFGDFNEDSISVAYEKVDVQKNTQTNFVATREYQPRPCVIANRQRAYEENTSIYKTRENLMNDRKRLEEKPHLEKKKCDDDEDSVVTYISRQLNLQKREALRVANEKKKLPEIVPVKNNYCAAGSESYLKFNSPKIRTKHNLVISGGDKKVTARKSPIETKIDFQKPEEMEEPKKPWIPSQYTKTGNPITFFNQSFDSSSSDSCTTFNHKSVSEIGVSSPPTKLRTSKDVQNKTVFMPAGACLNNFTQKPKRDMIGEGRGIGGYEKW